MKLNKLKTLSGFLLHYIHVHDRMLGSGADYLNAATVTYSTGSMLQH